MAQTLSVIGARQHNLKNVDCSLPREKLVVFTGPSGSGKTSLAFDTIHAEAYRRYVEFLPSNLRRSVQHLPRPDVDEVSGLSPSVAMKQGRVSPPPRATVGTVTEALDYFRVFFSRAARAFCPGSSEAERHEVEAYTVERIVSELLQLPNGTRVTLLTPILSAEPPASVVQALDALRDRGFVRVELNGTVVLLEDIDLESVPAQNSLRLVVDRLVIKEGLRARLTDSVELALRQVHPVVLADLHDGRLLRFSETLTCDAHQKQLPTPTAALFSHTSPQGACPACAGLGRRPVFAPERAVVNPRLTLRQGALSVLGAAGSVAAAVRLARLMKLCPLDPDVPWEESRLPEGFWAHLESVVEDEDEEALDGALAERERLSYFTLAVCPTCAGSRLGEHRDWFTVGARTFPDYAGMRLSELLPVLGELSGDITLRPLMPLLDVVQRKISAVCELGLGYLTLNSPMSRLSTGEFHRVRLSCLMNAALTGVLYVVDEPTAGLTPRDAELVTRALRSLAERGNTVLAVDHSRTLMKAADWLVDFGPGAGRLGGNLLASGPVSEVCATPASVTAPFLEAGMGSTRSPDARLEAPDVWLRLTAARGANLKTPRVDVPKGRLTAVTGRSGAGKTSLLMGALLPAVRQALALAQTETAVVEVAEAIAGVSFTRVVSFDQTSLGTSPRSTPATYVGIWDFIRELFASLPESRSRGFKAARFSFNTKGGRCETCKGEGVARTDLELLADVVLPCPQCLGGRFNRETLAPKFRGLDVAEVLRLTIDEAQRHFAHLPKVNVLLLQLQRVGLGYLSLGQASPTLSGGEAQRVKFALELSKVGIGETLYLFDEPTSGLHFADLPPILESLYALRDQGHTVVIAEPNPEVVAAADWVIELGPGPGDEGGAITFAGAAADWSNR